MPREQLEQKLRDGGAGEGEMIYVMAAYDAKAAYGENAIKAWDLSRAVSVLENGYVCGYCTYEEALNQAMEVAAQAQAAYDSWEAFNQSYLYGYSFWSEENLSSPDSGAAKRAGIVKELTERENGPFSIDWNTGLTREW